MWIFQINTGLLLKIIKKHTKILFGERNYFTIGITRFWFKGGDVSLPVGTYTRADDRTQ